MKVTVRLPIDNGTQVLVNVGDKIDSETPIFQVHQNSSHHILEIAKLLHIKPSEILRFLKVKPGDTFDMDAVIAEKRNIFSSLLIKSPVKGIFKDMDLKNGIITIVESTSNKTEKIKLPIEGKIKDISKSILEIEADGQSYEGKNGEGDDIFGELVGIEGEKIGILEINCEVNDKIVIGKYFLPETIIKLEVMGAIGVISENNFHNNVFPWIQVDKDTIIKLKLHFREKIWLRPKSHQIVTFN